MFQDTKRDTIVDKDIISTLVNNFNKLSIKNLKRVLAIRLQMKHRLLSIVLRSI